uniref:Major facilitator superfamily (MFS) profile domain-containing protein n=1 Tax=Helicotheca tamesis TaxID=374047 RepID=A0A7S2MCS9_9STRA|eukprot:CAMPEP_0185729318 /NCGR_PEP_ID=MMETSP1171-20130828/5092_1 /TAXON_ID=374046 /ORGANISM="Helicotheca tamensis, Strain CCMP826" /LENGTH=477 /DNA_ID=CAMNT_0028398125 /DNA_START=8 /DNA_END=1441 /DNA_ORIENTATION=-
MAAASETTALVDKKEDENSEDYKKLKKYQPWAFFVTFGGYFMAHFSRKCYSTVKVNFEEAGYSTLLISSMDSVFMGTYAVGNVVSGKLGDTFNPITVLAIGLFGSGACLFLLNCAIWYDFVDYSVSMASTFILTVYFFFGFFQSTGGPVGTAVMGNWFCDKASIKNRGLIFGLWTCHQYCGDVTAQLCTALVLKLEMPYWWGLIIPAITNVLWGFLTMTLIGDPADVGIVTEEVRIRLEKLEAARAKLAEGEVLEDTGPKPISLVGAFKIPMVASYAFAFGFFKLTNYTLFFWLPYFLEKRNFSKVTANLIAASYSVGMMPGGIIVGVVSDIFGGRRAAVIGVFMTLLFVLLFLFALFSEVFNTYVLLVMLAFMGILVGGPNNIITSAVAADLASHPSVRGNNKSLGTVTGLINGTGAITASLGLLVIGPLSKHMGWSAVWVFLMACTASGTLLMSPKIIAEVFPPKEVEEPKTEIV